MLGYAAFGSSGVCALCGAPLTQHFLHLFARLQHHKFWRGRDLFDAAEQAFELGVVVQVAVASYPRLAACNLGGAGLLEYVPGP